MAATSNFTTFYDGWLARQESLLRRLDALLSPVDEFDRNGECREMIHRVFSHYQELFQQIHRVADEDVFVALSPPWLSSFERSLLWVAGFRPSMMFPIIGGLAGEDLSGEQKRRLEEVKAETRRREKEITEAMARVQETVAEQPVYDLMRRFGKKVAEEEENDGEVQSSELEATIEELKAAMLEVVGNADELRRWAAEEVVGMLSPVGGVKVLAAAARFQLQSRNWGIRKDAARETIDLTR